MGANIKAIRARIRSVDSTRHITKAMELVAASKVRRASERMEKSRFFRQVMLDAFAGLSAEKSAYSVPRDESMPTLYVVIAGDRGLAGGYNNNIFRLTLSLMKDGDLILPIGKRAVDYFRGHGKTITDRFQSTEGFSSSDASDAAYRIKELYDGGNVGSVILVGTKFNTMLSQSPRTTGLLPLTSIHMGEEAEQAGDWAEKAPHPSAVTEYEPSAEEVLDALIPEFLAGVLYTSVCEAQASELAARRAAMDTATRNADEMLDTLQLTYNQARQSAITQEITEIVAGANA